MDHGPWTMDLPHCDESLCWAGSFPPREKGRVMIHRRGGLLCSQSIPTHLTHTSPLTARRSNTAHSFSAFLVAFCVAAAALPQLSCSRCFPVCGLAPFVSSQDSARLLARVGCQPNPSLTLTLYLGLPSAHLGSPEQLGGAVAGCREDRVCPCGVGEQSATQLRLTETVFCAADASWNVVSLRTDTCDKVPITNSTATWTACTRILARPFAFPRPGDSALFAP